MMEAECKVMDIEPGELIRNLLRHQEERGVMVRHPNTKPQKPIPRRPHENVTENLYERHLKPLFLNGAN